MTEYSHVEDAVAEIVASLSQIPETIESTLYVKDLENQIMENLRRKIAI